MFICEVLRRNHVRVLLRSAPSIAAGGEWTVRVALSAAASKASKPEFICARVPAQLHAHATTCIASMGSALCDCHRTQLRRRQSRRLGRRHHGTQRRHGSSSCCCTGRRRRGGGARTTSTPMRRTRQRLERQRRNFCLQPMLQTRRVRRVRVRANPLSRRIHTPPKYRN